MKFVKSIVTLMMAGAAFINSAETLAEPIPIRGVVEGFYGTPWTHENRLDMLNFCGTHGFNAYIYAPKDDVYHRAKWREPYPDDKLAELAALVQSANANNVKFIFAVSPGLDLRYGSKADQRAMIAKLSTMYNLGVRAFAIFFDDIQDKDGGAQAEFLNEIQKNFIDKYDDVLPLITVPTEYFSKDMIDDLGRKPYTANFSMTLNPKIMVLYTGEGVVQPTLTDEQYKTTSNAYNRNLGIWWNYPVNDYMENKLALGPIENLPQNSDIPAIFFNPMKYENLSKIALATAADYAKDPNNYNADNSWNKAIDEQFGNLAKDMKLFASYFQHLENNWANIGRPDAKISEATHQQLKALKSTIKKLQAKLPANILNECKTQLDELEKEVDAALSNQK